MACRPGHADIEKERHSIRVGASQCRDEVVGRIEPDHRGVVEVRWDAKAGGAHLLLGALDGSAPAVNDRFVVAGAGAGRSIAVGLCKEVSENDERGHHGRQPDLQKAVDRRATSIAQPRRKRSRRGGNR